MWFEVGHVYSFISQPSGKYLNREGSGALTSRANATVYQSTGNPDQRWKIIQDGTDYRIVSMLNQAFALNIYRSTQNCDITGYGGNETDTAVLFEASAGYGDMHFRIRLKNHVDKYLTATGSANSSNVNWQSGGSSAYQVWRLEDHTPPQPNGYTYPTDSSHRTLSRGFTGVNGHRGIDVVGAEGTPLYAFADGVVAYKQNFSTNIYPAGDSKSMESMGNMVCINHYNPNQSIAAGAYVQSVYMHMREPALVNPGATVHKGDVVGYLGNTGYSTGPHLHFNIGVSSQASMEPGYVGYTNMGSIGVIDPCRYLPEYHT